MSSADVADVENHQVNRTFKNLGRSFQILRFLGLLPFTKDLKFSRSLWCRSVLLSIILAVTIFPVELLNYFEKIPTRMKSFYRHLSATMVMLHKFSDFSILFAHVYATRRYKRQFALVCRHLMKFPNLKIDRLAFFMVLWSSTNHSIYTFYRTSMGDFKNFKKISFYIRSRCIFIVFLLARIALTHMYSGFLHYLSQRFRKASILVRQVPQKAVLYHAYLLELTNAIHLCFSLLMLLSLSDCVYSVIICTFFLTTLHVPNNRDLNFNKLSERVFLFGCLLYYWLLPINRCEKLKKEAESFNNELFKLMRDSKDLCNNSKLRLYVTMKQTVNFTACGFFSLGYPLVTSIIAAATTYLVILIQFGF